MLTTDIEESLINRKTFDAEMVENNAPPELADVLSRYIDEKKMKKADVIRKLYIDRNYGYQILNGRSKDHNNRSGKQSRSQGGFKGCRKDDGG